MPVALVFVLGLLALVTSSEAEKYSESVIRYPFQIKKVSQADEITRAEHFYKNKLKEDPTSGSHLALLASVYVQKAKLTGNLKLMDHAEQLAARSLIIFPFSNKTAKLVLASVAEARHDFSQAIKFAEEVLNENRQEEGALGSLITSTLGFGKIEQASQYAARYVARRPTIKAKTLQALVFEAQGNEQEAYRAFESAIRSEDIEQYFDSAWTRTFLGRLHMKRGHYELANAYFDEALRILPDCHLALALSAELKEIEADLPAADRLYSEAFNIMGEPHYLLKRAKLKLQLGDRAGAKRLQDQAEDLIREEMLSGPYGHHNELARVLLDRGGQKNLALAVIEASKDVEMRQNAGSYFLLAEAHAKSLNWIEARHAISMAIQSGIEEADIFYLASAIEESLGNSIAAELYLNKAKETNPRYRMEKTASFD